jgi:membrane dipeptidase
MHRVTVIIFLVFVLVGFDSLYKRQPAVAWAQSPSSDLNAKAQRLAKRFIIVDGHIDLPYRLNRSKGKDGKLTENVNERTPKGEFDYPRAVAGGLDAPFMSIYVPARYQEKGGAKDLADSLIDLVEGVIKAGPDKFARAHSVADVKRNFAAGLISLPMGIENGAAIEDDLKNLEHFYRRGVRYITLTHSKNNLICDSSYDDQRKWKGLSPFGKKVVAEMNRLGIMIDVSHLSDDSFYQIMEFSQTPVLATHSSARAFTPGWHRNMGDEAIKLLGKKGGVIMINFGSGFIEKVANQQYVARRNTIRAFRRINKITGRDPRVSAFRKEYDKNHPFNFSTVEVVADHIDHVVKLVGIDHVGLGSDFDGLGNTLPTGLKDASMYPNLFRVLLRRGYGEKDIKKISSDNVFRVWQKVEAYAGRN